MNTSQKGQQISSSTMALYFIAAKKNALRLESGNNTRKYLQKRKEKSLSTKLLKRREDRLSIVVWLVKGEIIT